MVKLAALLKAALAAVLGNILLVGAGIVVVLLSIGYLREQRARKAEATAYRAALEATAVELGGVVGQAEKQGEIIKRLEADQVAFLTKLGKVGRGELDSVTKTRVSLKDRIQFTDDNPSDGTLTGFGFSCSHHWSDPHGRFSLELPSGIFERKQSFDYSAIVVRSADGKSRVAKENFRELDPRTGEPITDENPAVLTSSFEFVETSPEAKAARHLFGFWPVIGLDVLARPLVGARLIDMERTGRPILKDFGLGVLAGYDRADKSGFGGAFVGYRILGSNVEAVGYYGASSSGSARAGAGIVFEITR